MDNIQRKAYQSIYNTFAKDCCDKYKFGDKYFEDIAEKAFNDFIKDKIPSKTPIIIRTAGQSGSGKTTQLMPSISEGLNECKINYIHLAVRKFAPYHPEYNKLLNEFGQGLIREKTNGFALMLLYRVLEKLIEKKYNIFFEVTLLENDFENNLLRLLKESNYKINYNIIFCPKEVSNYLIEIRKNSNTSLEKNRVVPKNTSDYFFEVLERAVNNIYKMDKYFSKGDSIICWDMYDLNPVLCVKDKVSEEFLDNFYYFRNKAIEKLSDENRLLEAKKAFYKKFIKEII